MKVSEIKKIAKKKLGTNGGLKSRKEEKKDYKILWGQY